MVSILINWIYIYITMLICGRFVLKRAYGFIGYDREVSLSSSVMAGTAVITAYAGYFSVFCRVGMAANIILIAADIIFLFIDRADIPKISKVFKSFKPWHYALFLLIILISAFFSCEGLFLWDTGLYHAQAIHWIEDYGVIIGSGHIQNRLAYNSSFFCLCALYGMRDIFGQSLHDLAGFYAAFMMIYALCGFIKDGEGLASGKKGLTSIITPVNIVRLIPFLYFLIVCSEIISPGTDYPIVFFVIYLSIRWFELIGRGEKEVTPYALLCVFTVFMVSIKLSAGVMVLLTIMPAYRLIRDKKWKDILVYIISGFLLILPYFIRNVIISGWLIYPFAAIDLFNVDWKIDREGVLADAREILVWARGTMGEGSPDDSIFVWFDDWWSYITLPDHKYIIAAFIAFACAIVRGVCLLTGSLLKRRMDPDKDEDKGSEAVRGYVYYEIIICLSLLFWMKSGPLVRYGFAFIVTMPLVFIADILSSGVRDLKTGKHRALSLVKLAPAGLIAIIMLIPTIDYIKWDIECLRYRNEYRYAIMQKDYPKVETGMTRIGSIDFYYPMEDGSQIFYEPMPAVLWRDVSHVKMRGNDIRDGFMSADHP